MSTELTASDTADHKKLRAAAIAAFNKTDEGWHEFGVAIKQIRDRELWRGTAKSWTEYVDGLAADLGKSARSLFRLLRTETIRQKLLKKVTDRPVSKNTKSLAKTINSLSKEAVLAAGAAAEEQQVEVLEQASAQFNGGVPSAPAIAAVVKVHGSAAPDPHKKDTWPKDEKQTPIPPPAWPFWTRRSEVQPSLTQISDIKSMIAKSLTAGDALYAWIGNPAIDFLSSAYAAISNAKLYAVCTVCQGWGPQKGGCADCHNTGLISKHHYDVCSKREVKAIRERANLQR